MVPLNKIKQKSRKGCGGEHASYKGKHSPAFFLQRSSMYFLLLEGRGLAAMTPKGHLQSAFKQVLCCPRGPIGLVLNFTHSWVLLLPVMLDLALSLHLRKGGWGRPSLVPGTKPLPRPVTRVPPIPWATLEPRDGSPPSLFHLQPSSSLSKQHE